ncbi:MAG: AhpC/TSA family protein [Chitinophagaceae bacterium]|nr:AhpC/TSA family protein [Chitinophagaceae bacterium]
MMKRNLGILLFMLLFSVFAFSQEAPEGLFIASKAPDFKAKDQNGDEIRLKDLLKKGKVIIVFYRGQWCPYCNRFLSVLQDSLQFIKDKGASLVAVSPEKLESVAGTVEKTKAEFPVLYDEGLKILKAYDVEYEVPENTLTRYRNSGIDVEKNNGPNGKYLPITAVFIIGDEQTVIYRFFEKDYKKRPAVIDLLKQL